MKKAENYTDYNDFISTLNNLDVSNSEAYFAFESFAINVIKDYVSSQSKGFSICDQYKFDKNEASYDVYLPDGFGENSIPTYIEILYSRQNKSSYFQKVKNVCAQNADNEYIEQLLIVLAVALSNESKTNLHIMAQSITKSKIVIWDIDDFFEFTHKFFPEHIHYLEEPKKAILDQVISTVETEDDKNALQRSRLASLKNKYNDEDVVLFLGAGISIDANVPLWDELINNLLFAMINDKLKEIGKSVSISKLKSLVDFAHENKEDSPITQMRYIRSAFEQSKYNRLVHDVLYQNRPKTRTPLLNSIAKIASPQRSHIGVKSIVTYNFDDLLERCLNSNKIDFRLVCTEADIPETNKLNISHVHGFIPHRNEDFSEDNCNIVFSEEDYHKMYRDAYCWSNIVQLSAFRDSTCLFIGCSLNDPNLRRLLDVASRNGEMPRHYAFLKRKSLFKNTIDNSTLDRQTRDLYESIDHNIREKFFSSIGINIIWFDEFEEIPELLLWLRK